MLLSIEFSDYLHKMPLRLILSLLDPKNYYFYIFITKTK